MSDAVKDLLERLRAATGPDREIEFALFELVEAGDRYREMIANARRRIEAGELTESDLLNWRVFSDSYSARALGSIDAALALVEAKGWRPYKMDASIIGRFSWMIASVEARPLRDEDDRPYMGIEYASGYAPTPALALLIALLEALKEQA